MSENLLSGFLPLWYFKLNKFQTDSLEVLRVLHTINKIPENSQNINTLIFLYMYFIYCHKKDNLPTNYFRNIWKWIIRTKNVTRWLFFTQYLLIALWSSNMLCIVLTYKIWNQKWIDILKSTLSQAYIRDDGLTEFHEALRKLKHALKAPVLGVGCPRQRIEDDQQPFIAGVQHQVALLAAVGANLSRRVIRAIEYAHIIKRTAGIRHKH